MKISIIIPCYNAIGKVEACINSIKHQMFPVEDYEVIFVDDKSKDDTHSYLKRLASENYNWKVFQMEENSGSPSAPRNYGVDVANGKYVFFLDCDDEIIESTLVDFYDFAIKNNADIVRGYLMVDDGNHRYAANKLNLNNELNKDQKISTIISKQSTTPPCLIKRSILKEHNIKWNPLLRMGEDTVFLVDVLMASERIFYIDHPCYVYNKRISNEPSSTQIYGARELKNHLKVWNLVQDKLLSISLDYFSLRLQVGLQTAIKSMISYNSYDISPTDFDQFHKFILENKPLIETFNYSDRLKGVLEKVYENNYDAFIEEIKPRMAIAGYDLKFIKSLIPELSKFYTIKVDEWTGHNHHDVSHSMKCLQWAEIVFCEWMLGNAVWYSKRIRKDQKLFIRMHRFELTTSWYKDINFRNVNRVFAVSIYFFEKLIEYTGLPRSMACLLPNYLDVNKYDSSDKEDKLFNLGIIGILPSRKGYLSALKILKSLKEHDSRYRLFVFGKMPQDLSWIAQNDEEMSYYNSCESYIIKNNLQNNVIIKGWVDVKKELKDIGFILSTSHSEEIPESFHIAPADGFAAMNQGLLLNWNGVEYIYPDKYIFQSETDIADHILKQNSITEFNNFKKEGYNLVSRRYSINSFIENLGEAIKLSENRFDNAPFLSSNQSKNTNLDKRLNLINCKLEKEIVIDIPDTIGKNHFILSYILSCSVNTRESAALISLKTENNNSIQGFKESDKEEIGFYRYMDTISNGNLHSLKIYVPNKDQIKTVKLMLWQKDADIIFRSLNVAPLVNVNESKQVFASVNDCSLTNTNLIMDVPDEYKSIKSFILKYMFSFNADVKENAVLISLKTKRNLQVKDFMTSDLAEIGSYKYLNTVSSGESNLLRIDIPDDDELMSIHVVLWQKDAKIQIETITLSI